MIENLVVIGGAIVGQVVHLVKKGKQEKKDMPEVEVFKRWVLQKPFNTIGAMVGGILAAIALNVEGIDPLMQFLQAVTAGYMADSMGNRPGPGSGEPN